MNIMKDELVENITKAVNDLAKSFGLECELEAGSNRIFNINKPGSKFQMRVFPEGGNGTKYIYTIESSAPYHIWEEHYGLFLSFMRAMKGIELLSQYAYEIDYIKDCLEQEKKNV